MLRLHMRGKLIFFNLKEVQNQGKILPTLCLLMKKYQFGFLIIVVQQKQKESGTTHNKKNI